MEPDSVRTFVTNGNNATPTPHTSRITRTPFGESDHQTSERSDVERGTQARVVRVVLGVTRDVARETDSVGTPLPVRDDATQPKFFTCAPLYVSGSPRDIRAVRA